MEEKEEPKRTDGTRGEKERAEMLGTVLIGRLHFMRWTGPSCNWSPLNCRSLGNCPFFAPTVTTAPAINPGEKKIYPLSR